MVFGLRKLPLYLAALLFSVVCLFPGASGARAQEPAYSVLVLNSYHAGFYWSDEETRGVLAALPDNVDVSVEYMDSKRLESEDYLAILFAMYRVKFKPDAFDCIIALDEYAFHFMMARGSVLFPDTPVVFGGLNRFTPDMLGGREDVTGLLEVVDSEDAIKAGLALYPGAEQVLVISDQTASGVSNRTELESLVAAGRFDVEIVFLDQGDGLDMAGLTEQLRAAPANSIVYYADFFRDKHGEYLDYLETMPVLAAASRVPIFVHADMYLGHGVVGGKVISGFHQGEMAANMASRILAGEPAASIPIQTSGASRYMFDDVQLRRWGIARRTLPAESVVVNGPDSLYAQYKTGIWLVVAFIGTQAGIIALLLTNSGRRRQAEKALAQERNLLRTVIDTAPDSIYVKDRESRFLVANDAVSRAMGASGPHELLGKTDMDFYPPDLASRYLADERQVLASGEAVVDREEPVPGAQGDVRWYSTTKVPLRGADGSISGTIGVGRDLTERRRAAAEIRRRNEELMLLNTIIAAVAASDDVESLLRVACRELALAFDAALTAVYTLDSGDAGRLLQTAWYKRDGSHLPAWQPHTDIKDSLLWNHLQSGKEIVLVGRAPVDASLLPAQTNMLARGACQWVAAPLKGEGGAVGALFLEWEDACPFDLQERRLLGRVADQLSVAIARAASMAEQRRWSAAVEQMAENLIITNAEGAITYVNPAFETLTGYSRKEVTGRSPDLLQSDAHEAAFHADLWSTVRAGRLWKGQIVNRKKDGSQYTVDATISPVLDTQGRITHFVGVERDVSDELKLQEQYRRSQRMEAVGQLTAGIAHDFNNLLTAINGFAELTQGELDPAHPTQAYVSRILAAGQRAAQLVSQLLAFSRKQMISPKVLNLNELVSNMIHMLTRTIGEHIHLQTALAADLWAVKMDPAQVEQVLLNLAVNARDAMPSGGKLTIGTLNVRLDADTDVQQFEVQAGDYVMLSVADTGCGMSAEVQACVFEPFFTTKEVGKGTGLGLSTVFGIVKQNHGYVTVTSEVGQGSVLQVYFPAWRLPVDAPPVGDTSTAPVPKGNETILLVEDNDQVRELSAQVLQRQGYNVLVANDGAEAHLVAEKHGAPIHLLVTDVVMPGQSGREVAEILLACRPGLKVLFISGYEGRDVTMRGLMQADAAFLQKPFQPTALAHKVREVLDG